MSSEITEFKTDKYTHLLTIREEFLPDNENYVNSLLAYFKDYFGEEFEINDVDFVVATNPIDWSTVLSFKMNVSLIPSNKNLIEILIDSIHDRQKMFKTNIILNSEETKIKNKQGYEMISELMGG